MLARGLGSTLHCVCTVVAVCGGHPSYPLIVVANRDEFYSRRSEGPQVLSTAPRVIGGRDLESGGSWMGFNEHGLFVALTNQRTWSGPAPQLRSRGRVVAEALKSTDTAQLVGFLERLDGRDYNSFNLLFGKPGELWVAYARAEDAALELERVDEPVVVLTNDRLHSEEFPKATRAAARIEAALATGEPGQLALALADHERPSLSRLPTPPAGARFPPELVGELQALCIHTPRYGTVSSTTLLWDEAGQVCSYLFADGAPCTHAPRDFSALLEA